MDVDRPAGRLLRPPVVGVDPLQVLIEITTERRVDIDLRIDAAVHLLLHESRMEMAGVESHQPDVRHGSRVLLPGLGSDDRQPGRERNERNCDAHGKGGQAWHTCYNIVFPLRKTRNAGLTMISVNGVSMRYGSK